MLEAAQPLVVVRARQGRGQCGGPAHAAAAAVAAAATTLDGSGPPRGCRETRLSEATAPPCTAGNHGALAPRRGRGRDLQGAGRRWGAVEGQEGGGAWWKREPDASEGAGRRCTRGEAGGFCLEKGVFFTLNSSQFSTERP